MTDRRHDNGLPHLLRRSLAALGLVLALAMPSPARADDGEVKARARALAEQGAKAHDRGDYEVALAKLSEALSLVSVPTIGIEVARTLAALDRLGEAIEAYRATESMTLDPSMPSEFAEVQRATQRDARRERERLELQRPVIELRLAGEPPSTLSLDGRSLAVGPFPMTVAVDPGEHEVIAERGPRRWSQRATLTRGQTEIATVTWPAPSTQPMPMPVPMPITAPRDEAPAVLMPLGWTAVGLGGAAAIVSLGTYLRASALGSDLDGRCPDRVCRSSTAGTGVENDIATYDTFRTVSMVTFGVSLGLLMTGTGLLVSDAVLDDGAPSTTSLRLGPTAVTLTQLF